MRISALDGQRVALWGYGSETRATLAAIRRQLPTLPLTLLCSADEADAARAAADPALRVSTEVDADVLAGFQVVIKSPGISPYRAPAAEAIRRGTRMIGATALWFAEIRALGPGAAKVVCVTGTKGKSTTSALIAHLLRAGGHRTALAGNIGMPLLAALDAQPQPAFWVVELSSYQTRDAVLDAGPGPDVAVVLNVFPEHLDWHGSEAAYVDDKLALVTDARPGIALLNAADPRLAALAPRQDSRAPHSRVLRFNAADDAGPAGWRLREDGLICRGDTPVLDARMLPLPGRHNRINLCAALAAIDALGLDAAALAEHAAGFQPLPHRLQWLGARDGIDYVNDSISTTPHASLAALDWALESHPERPVAILVGGHDRGLDWGVFAARMADAPPAAVVTVGQNGPRIHALLAPLAGGRDPRFVLRQAPDMDAAVAAGRHVLGCAGLLLLSPGAPSFGRYRDYAERGRHFAQVAGFDPERISAIVGLGVA